MNTSELEALANDLRPWGAKPLGSIRIDVREVSKIVAGLDEVSTLRQQIEALEAENGRLREALKPFADTGEFLDLETTGFADEDVLNLIVEDGHLLERISVGAFRTARQALGEG